MLPAPSSNDDHASEPEDAGDLAPTPVQPAGSVIELTRFADGISIRVPPAGLWNGSRGLFVFSLAWNVFTVLLTLGMVGAFLSDRKNDGNLWVIPVFMLVFLAVGIGTLLVSIQMGTRQAGLAVAGGTLMVLQTGLLGKKQREWPLDEIAAICVGPTGMEVNNKPILELQIHDADGSKLSLLAGRTDDELEWLAHELREAAKVGESD